MAKRVWYAYDEVEDPVSGALHHLTVTHEIDPADPPAWMVFALRRHLDSEYGKPTYAVSARAALVAALSATPD